MLYYIQYICNSPITWSSLKLLKLEPAVAKKVQNGMGWLGFVTNLKSEPGSARARKKVGYPSSAQLGLQSKLNIDADLGSCLGFSARFGSGSDIN